MERLTKMSQVLKEIGEELASAREHKGLEIEELANRLKIRHRYLLAIEHGELEELPVSAYIIGYLRSYASALGLDGDNIVSRFKDETDDSRKEESTLPVPHKKEMRPVPVILLISLVAAVALYVYWYKAGDDFQSKIANAVQNFRKDKKPTAVNVEAAEDKRANVAELPATLESHAGDAKEGGIPKSVVVISEIVRAPGAELILLAKGTTWIQLLTNDNNFLMEKKLHPGESYNIPARDDLVLRSGKPESIEVYARSEGKDALLGTLSTFSQSPLSGLSPASGIPLEE